MSAASLPLVAIFVGVFAAVACSDDDARRPGPDAGTGGASTGGNSSTGGATSTGGSATTGGATATGGTSTGGHTGSGGSATGGSANGGNDGGVPDAGEPPDGAWEGCPTASDYAGDAAFPHPLTVTDDATYCATFNEFRTLKEELAAKAQLRLAPGVYRLPAADRTGLALPACVRFDESASPAVALKAGDVKYHANTYENQVTHDYGFEQPLTALGVASKLTLDVSRSVTLGTTPAFVLDGTEVDLRADHSQSFLLCPASGDCFPVLSFDSCAHAGSRLHTHVVTFGGDDGKVTFELRIGESFASTEPGAFVHASGTFHGTAFDQKNYWKLVYNPFHHHFVRNFAVLFDAPIDGACGLQVKGLEPFDGNSEPDVAAAVDCALNETGALTVQSHEYTADPLP